MWKRARFKDRRDAGRRLGERLKGEVGGDVVVMGLPRGGVEVAFEVARVLKAPLDVIVVRKIGAPMQPELGVGAVAPGGLTILDESTIGRLGLSDAEIERIAEKERAEMKRRQVEYRGGERLPDVSGRTVVIVDDGLATGMTALGAVRAARAAQAETIVLAVPVCAKPTAEQIAAEVDRLVCLEQPEDFVSVGTWYTRFDQTTDAEVIELLEESRDAVSPEEISEL